MSSTSAERVRAALTAARKNRDEARTLLYSTILSDIGNHEIRLGRPATDADVLDVITRAIKQRRESVEAYAAAARTELAEREAFEIRELEPYLPPAVGEAEIRSAVRAALADGAADLGAVMGRVMPGLKGRADGKLINSIAREELAART